MKEKFLLLPWKNDPDLLHRWQKGFTGYPFVDAGMRQLWATGWMHNRARMVVGSFLVKDLLLSWQEGEKWFWDTLVDADMANNCLGWQWVAGCGIESSPFFRIINPVQQGKKFDPEGSYVRKWVPELSKLANEWIHHPFDAPEKELQNAEVFLGKNYPYPIVNHEQARQRALSWYKKLSNPV